MLPGDPLLSYLVMFASLLSEGVCFMTVFLVCFEQVHARVLKGEVIQSLCRHFVLCSGDEHTTALRERCEIPSKKHLT